MMHVLFTCNGRLSSSSVHRWSCHRRILELGQVRCHSGSVLLGVSMMEHFLVSRQYIVSVLLGESLAM